MPLAKYDYDYYEYVNGHRITENRASSNVRSTSSQKNNSYANQRASTAKKISTNGSNIKKVNKSNVSKKSNSGVIKNVVKGEPSSKKEVVKKVTKKANIDIPINSKSNIKNKPMAMSLKKPKVKTNYLSVKSFVFKTFGIVSFFVIAFLICYRYSLINEQFVELRNIKKDYATVQTVNSQIQADIESKTDLTYIENYAKYQLGMQKPSGSQVQYVTVEKEDKIMSPITIEEEEDLGLFNKICSKIYELFK